MAAPGTRWHRGHWGQRPLSVPRVHPRSAWSKWRSCSWPSTRIWGSFKNRESPGKLALAMASPREFHRSCRFWPVWGLPVPSHRATRQSCCPFPVTSWGRTGRRRAELSSHRVVRALKPPSQRGGCPGTSKWRTRGSHSIRLVPNELVPKQSRVHQLGPAAGCRDHRAWDGTFTCVQQGCDHLPDRDVKLKASSGDLPPLQTLSPLPDASSRRL